jgi:hypothetical protein
MDQRNIRKIADHLARRPIGRIVTVVPVSDHDYIISIEDRRDGREHGDRQRLRAVARVVRAGPTASTHQRPSVTAVARSTQTRTSMANSSNCVSPARRN